MKVALIDVDGRHFPNLALMRLSAWHKARGDDVEWWNGFTHYDRAYLSKVFTFTPDFGTVIDADEIITGGTGYKDYSSLPPEVEATPPDYAISIISICWSLSPRGAWTTWSGRVPK